MLKLTRCATACCLAVAVMATAPARAADDDLDALNLQSAEPVATPASAAKAGSSKLYLEAAVGNASQRYLPDDRRLGRISVDFSLSAPVSTGLRAIFSDRLDAFDPALAGTDHTVNSLREAYLSWQNPAGNRVLEAGRINLRYGPAYGYNPTDFFRDGSLRVLTTADPFALRENRLGTFMLRGQTLWDGGSFSLAYAPKLANQPSTDGWSVDAGATNHRHRALAVLGNQWSPRLSTQTLLYQQQGYATTLGFNLTALLSDAATAHLEFTRGSEPDLRSRALGLATPAVTRNRFSGGATYTTLGKLSLTAEYQYNGFGLDQTGWNALTATPGAPLTYLGEALRLQELAPRQAYLLYATQKSLGLKDLDLTAYVRFNPGDDSKLAWLELRHHWPNADLALQWQQNIGAAGSEFGLLPDRRVVQLLGNYYF